MKKKATAAEIIKEFKNRTTESLITQKIDLEAKLETIKNFDLPVPAVSLAIAVIALSINTSKNLVSADLINNILISITAFGIICLIVGLLSITYSLAIYARYIKSIEYELNKREKIDLAYEAALLYKKEIENSIKNKKMFYEEKRKERLKAKYCSKR